MLSFSLSPSTSSLSPDGMLDIRSEACNHTLARRKKRAWRGRIKAKQVARWHTHEYIMQTSMEDVLIWHIDTPAVLASSSSRRKDPHQKTKYCKSHLHRTPRVPQDATRGGAAACWMRQQILMKASQAVSRPPSCLLARPFCHPTKNETTQVPKLQKCTCTIPGHCDSIRRIEES